MSLRGKIEIVGASHEGLVRGHNEDAFGFDVEAGLAVLADGMGGLKAGEVASEMAVRVVRSEVLEALAALAGGEPQETETFAEQSKALRRAVVRANETIWQVAQSQPQYSGMGTTVVAMLCFDDRVGIAHVGDSRVYRMRGGELEQLTTDHSLVQELVDQGFYTPEQARVASNKNIVTRALGIAPEVECDLMEDVALKDDVYLLCSDGLTDMVFDEGIQRILESRSDDLQQAADALVRTANDHGGRDNVSVVLLRVNRAFPNRNGWFARLTSWFD